MRPILCALLLITVVGACTTAPVTPREQFSRACATSTEAMLGVNKAYDLHKVDQATYDRLADTWFALHDTCRTLPADDSAGAAIAKIDQFLNAAGGVTGATYSY